MKNNLKSLVNTRLASGKAKIDHEQGEWVDLLNNDWEISRMGYYGKDLSDSVVASCMLADLYGTDNADFVFDLEKESQKNTSSVDLALVDIKNKFNLKINKNLSFNKVH